MEKKKITEALFEIINGLHGFNLGKTKADKELATKKRDWYKEAKIYLKQLTKDKNIVLSGKTIIIQDKNGKRMLHKITIN